MGSPDYVLIWDGECGVCRRSVAWLEGADRDGRIETVPYQDPSVPDRFPGIPEDRYQKAMQLVGPRGEWWEGARAAEEMLRLLPGWRRLSFLFRIPGVRRVAAIVYRQVARNRRRFGCGDHCGVRP
jgi:predicted DCC family thiol-disulfide oxidoreductase YuxK